VPAGSDATPDVRERIVFTAQFGAGITAAVARRQQVRTCAEFWRGTVVQRLAGR
jgi:anti-sigma-K factor RskA